VRIYNEIIDHFTKNPITDGEKHHIIPRSLGGTDDESNLVRLSVRAHYVCHILLTKIYHGKEYCKMVYALWMMSNQSHRRITSRQYERIRTQFALTHSERMRKKTQKLIKAGLHNWQGGTQQKMLNEKRIRERTHNFLGEKNPSHNRVAEGTHNFLDKNAASKRNKKRLANGTHVFQNKSEEHIKKIAKANSKQVEQLNKDTGE